MARLCIIAGANMPQIYQLARAASDTHAADLLADKRRFAAWCAAQALPSVPTVAELEGGCLVRSLHADGRLPSESLFSKWSAGFGGDDTASWQHDDGLYYGSDGRRLTSAELIAALAVQSRTAPIDA